MSETEDFQKRIERFLEGRDPQKYIVGIEPDYMKPLMHLIIHDPEKGKSIKSFKYKPFLWSTLIILGSDNPILFICLDTLINSWFLFSEEVDSIKSKLLFNL